MARNPDGTFATEHDANPKAVLERMEPGIHYTTGEIAEVTGAPRRTVYNYLGELQTEGAVKCREPNSRLTLWWVVE